MKKQPKVKMYPALALLIVRRAIKASKAEQQAAFDMIMAGPQGQDFFGAVEK